MEHWKPIEGWPYEVSDMGRVRRSEPDRTSPAGKVLRVRKGGEYHMLTLCNNGDQRRVYVHHLVLEAFVGPRPSDAHECNHRDGDKLNNRPDNLEWVTRSENIKHAYENGLATPNNRKLDPAQVAAIRELLDEGVPQARLAAAAGVSQKVVSRISRGEAYASVN